MSARVPRPGVRVARGVGRRDEPCVCPCACVCSTHVWMTVALLLLPRCCDLTALWLPLCHAGTPGPRPCALVCVPGVVSRRRHAEGSVARGRAASARRRALRRATGSTVRQHKCVHAAAARGVATLWCLRGASSACVGAGGSWQLGGAAQGATTCVTACPDRGGDAGGGFGPIGLVGCGGDGAGVCVEACSARAAWRCESASACGGTGGTWRGSQCEAPTTEACARGSSTWCGYAVVPVGIGVLAMVRDRCERVQGYCRNVLVAPEGVTASSMAAARGMWCRCGSVELPICRRMRGSGWRMGGVISGVY